MLSDTSCTEVSAGVSSSTRLSKISCRGSDCQEVRHVWQRQGSRRHAFPVGCRWPWPAAAEGCRAAAVHPSPGYNVILFGQPRPAPHTLPHRRRLDRRAIGKVPQQLPFAGRNLQGGQVPRTATRQADAPPSCGSCQQHWCAGTAPLSTSCPGPSMHRPRAAQQFPSCLTSPLFWRVMEATKMGTWEVLPCPRLTP